MKRIASLFGKFIVIVAALVAVVYLARSAYSGVLDLIERNAARQLHESQKAAFPGTATVIYDLNARLSYEKTHAPTPTATPTESDDMGDPGDTGEPVTLEAPDDQTPGPQSQLDTASVDAANAAPRMALSPTDLETATAEPSDTPEPTATDVSPTNIEPPTKVVIMQTIPPTNTKRPSSTVIPTNTKAPTIPPTATPLPPTATVPPTLPPIPSATTAPTLVPTTAATSAPTTAAQLVPAAGPTSKLPTVVLPAERAEKPQVTAIPTRAPRVNANKNDIMNILLIGSDADLDPSDPSFRTDTLMIVSINRTTNTVAMLSIPRDLFVYIPSLGMQRINTAYFWGQAVNWNPGKGFGLLQATILYNLGIPVHYYARISFTGFKKIVDTLNGVDIAVDCQVSDLRFQGQYNELQTPVYSKFTMEVGYHHMDGSLALWYARMRKESSDFDRNRRQQQVLRAIWRTAREQGLISKAPELWGQVNEILETNMQLPDVLGLVPLALNLKPGDISSYYMVKGYETMHWRTPQGEDIQLPDPKGFFKTINDFYTPPTSNRLGKDGMTIEIWNGSAVKDMDRVAAERLLWDGFEPQAKGAGDPTAKTVVYDFTGSAKPGTLQAMLKALNVKADRVVSQPDPNRTVDFRVVLGADYNSCSAPGYAK
ncbi:MAG: LCP family protein [Anaerolineae bacterium]|nr:LCP family protein [Anaerolineae bacterium]